LGTHDLIWRACGVIWQVAHGNSIRALLAILDGIPPEAVAELEVRAVSSRWEVVCGMW
jgi:broad specificity phosphatase PhoE